LNGDKDLKGFLKRASMKTGKFVSRIIVLLLVFFLTTAGAAQALNLSKCKGECCRNIPEKSHHRGSVHGLSAHPSIEFETPVLLCDPIQQFRALASKTPEQGSCHTETVPSCCEMTQAGDKVEGLTSTALSRADRPLEIGPVCISSEILATNNTFNTTSARYSIPARARPVPLYLKNSVFLC
jgi:hypothetical protein